MVSCLSRAELFETLWTIALQALVHGILQGRILEWFVCPLPGDLPYSGIKPMPLMSPELAGEFFTTSANNTFYEIIKINAKL